MISPADLAGILESPSNWLVVSADGSSAGPLPANFAVLPGSFNPVHEGHWQLAATAQRILARPVLFELSVRNVDKPPLGLEDTRARLAQFHGRGAVALTCAPFFADKARLFPRTTFVVGADTVARLLEPRYYDGEMSKMHETLTRIHDSGCRFLVAGRKDAAGRWVALDDLAVPASFRHLFTAIAPSEFQFDVSSSQLRSSSK